MGCCCGTEARPGARLVDALHRPCVHECRLMTCGTAGRCPACPALWSVWTKCG